MDVLEFSLYVGIGQLTAVGSRFAVWRRFYWVASGFGAGVRSAAAIGERNMYKRVVAAKSEL